MAGLQGLDCAGAPSAAKAKQMLDQIGGRWWNVYVGGPSSSASGWSPELIREYVRHGIDRFMLTYAGQQAGGVLTPARAQIDAHDALQRARQYGYSGSFPLCLDIELRGFTSVQARMVDYVRAWCEEVRKAGARPGIYANPVPLTAMAGGRVHADFVWVASWVTRHPAAHDPHASVGLSAHLWPHPGQRAWQYAGMLNGVPCTVLGVEVDISVADLGCLALAPGEGSAPARPRPRVLRKGARGATVVRFTHRLSVVRSRRTGRPYLDGPRRSLDAQTQAALTAFQREHGLSPSGAYGSATARVLLQATKEEKRARQAARPHPSARPTATKPAPAATRLPALVKQFQRLDAEANRAWQSIEAYGKQRLRLPAHVQADSDAGLAAITDSLARIEHQLGTLVELEQRELARAETSAEHDTAASHDLVIHAPDSVAAGTGAVPAAGVAPQPPPPHRQLADLTDAELDHGIEALDHRLDRWRRERIARYARVEKRLLPHAPGRAVVPAHAPKPGPPPKPGTTPAKPAAKPHHHPAAQAKSPLVATDATRSLQRSLNRFTQRYLRGIPPLDVDGKKGTETDKRIHTIKYYLGYGAAERTAVVTSPFVRRLRHPRSPRFSGPGLLARAARRRQQQRKAARRVGSSPIEGTPKHIVDTIVLPIAEACGIHVTPATIVARNAIHGPTRTGRRSDHEGPPQMAWAADMSNGTSPTPQMDALARRLAQRFDIAWHGAGFVQVSHHGYRFQMLYRTEDHFNHVHFGIKVD